VFRFIGFYRGRAARNRLRIPFVFAWLPDAHGGLILPHSSVSGPSDLHAFPVVDIELANSYCS